MSEWVSTPCACGVDIVSASPDEDEVSVALAAHNCTPWHRRYRAALDLERANDELDTRRGPCICKGGPAGPKRYWPRSAA